MSANSVAKSKFDLALRTLRNKINRATVYDLCITASEVKRGPIKKLPVDLNVLRHEIVLEIEVAYGCVQHRPEFSDFLVLGHWPRLLELNTACSASIPGSV